MTIPVGKSKIPVDHSYRKLIQNLLHAEDRLDLSSTPLQPSIDNGFFFTISSCHSKLWSFIIITYMYHTYSKSSEKSKYIICFTENLCFS